MNIKQMYENGVAISEIARRTGRDRKTIRKWIQSDGPPKKVQRRRPSKLDEYKEYIISRMQEGVLNATVIYDEIKNKGYKGKITILMDFMQPYRPVLTAQATIRYETGPGEQAQVDWAHFGYIIDLDGAHRPLYCFVMVLSYSRMLYLEFTTSQDVATLLKCHINAFEFFGGIPKEILYDNTKTVTLGRDDNGHIIWNERFLDFSVHFNFTPRLCRPYRARTKGKVERPIRYIRENFFPGRKFNSLEDLNFQAHKWRDEKANVRIHSTTLEKPVTLWANELLQPYTGYPDFDLAYYCQRKVSRDCLVSYKCNFYSVPWQLIGRDVLLRITGDQLQIYWQGKMLTQHTLVKHKRYQRIEKLEHYYGLPGRGVTSRRRKNSVTVLQPPQVEKRSLDYYESLVWEGVQ